MGGLYHDTHKSFAAYVKERWGQSRSWADKTISASYVVLSITDAVNESADDCPQKPNEWQARALAKAPPEQQAEVWAEVVEEHGEKVTAPKK